MIRIPITFITTTTDSNNNKIVPELAESNQDNLGYAADDWLFGFDSACWLTVLIPLEIREDQKGILRVLHGLSM